MARAPPVNLFRPPDQSHQRRSEETIKSHQEPASNSSYNSTKSRNTEAMNIAISERELDGIQRFISPDRDKLIHRKLFSRDDSPTQGLQHTQKSHESITPIVRSEEANSEKIGANPSELRLQIRPISHQFHGDSTTGDCSLGDEVHLTTISSEMAGQITGDMNSGEQIVEGDADDIGGNCSLDEELRLTNISTKLAQNHSQTNIQTGSTKSAANTQIENEEHSCRPEEPQQKNSFHGQARPKDQRQDHNAIGKQQIEKEEAQVDTRNQQGQNDQLDSTSATNLEIRDVENSSHFSFGVNPVGVIPSYEGHQNTGTTANEHQFPEQKTKCGQHAGSSDTSGNDSANGQKNVMREEQEIRRGATESQQQGNRFQNVVRDKNVAQPNDQRGHTNSNQQNQQIHQPNQPKEPNNPNENQNPKQNQSVVPAPYTVVQTLAARLRQIHATQTIPIELVPPKHTTKQGQPAVIFDMDDFMNKLAVDCKYTLIGKFSTTMPKIELIRKSFILQTQLNGGVNIAHYNARHVFIDLENELDYNTVWTQQRMTIEGKLMRIQAWSPNFRPEEETPIVPIWVLLPGLPWHCFKKEFVTPLLESVGKVLYLDTASIKRTRASMAKVKVQIDLTKDRPRHIWIGLDDEDLTIGRWQPIEYENIPPYCTYCKHQGHMIGDCNFKIRDEDFKRRKELGAEMQNINKGEQGQQGKEHRQIMSREQEEQQPQQTKEGGDQQPPGQQKEEEWQVPRRRNNRPQEEKTQKTMWRPTSPQNKVLKEHPQHTAQQTGISNNSNYNSFTNLNMQGKQVTDIQEQNSKEKITPQGTQSRSKIDHNQVAQTKQTGNQTKTQSTGIDSMLPIPINPNNSYFNGIAEAEGGMDGGCQKSHTNLQERGSKGGNLTHVLHEGKHFDPSPDLRTPATTASQHPNPVQQKVQQKEQTEAGKQANTGIIREKQQEEVSPIGKHTKGSMAKDMGAHASTSNQDNTPKSKNKPSKKKREAAKKRQNLQQQNKDQQEEQPKEGAVCKKFIMVDDQLGMDITPLQTQYMNPPINVPPDERPEKCQMNKGPIIDEYAVDNSEDELDMDNQSLKDHDEEEETSELLIRAFSPHPDKSYADEVHQVANKQGLSPRGIQYDKFQFKTQDINTVTAGRPNTRLFTPRSS
ncbi:hypothetical protein KY290_011893 [Solanum tuberosum]|uniref:DUF4283 domain-containing protein n=1 Tax=Solanum tuberosum TaxID=4113 RepID=A0ABQ7W1Y7_SOLTU|nr:hypothetical protein KY285_011923 [Solanum tuberosum]KAH0774756.1 hypothetical protein KY290_011893 [Solanum tuberosum]